MSTDNKPFVISKNPNGISLNGKVFLKDEDNEILRFSTPQAALDHYNEAVGTSYYTVEELEKREAVFVEKDKRPMPDCPIRVNSAETKEILFNGTVTIRRQQVPFYAFHEVNSLNGLKLIDWEVHLNQFEGELQKVEIRKAHDSLREFLAGDHLNVVSHVSLKGDSKCIEEGGDRSIINNVKLADKIASKEMNRRYPDGWEKLDVKNKDYRPASEKLQDEFNKLYDEAHRMIDSAEI